MNSFAEQLTTEDACAADLKLGNPSVTQALNGLIAYQPLYAAGCMKDSDGNYCKMNPSCSRRSMLMTPGFANAVTNDTSTEDSFIYYLPLGTKLPGGSRPTCNTCLTDTMAVFHVAAGNDTQPLSQTYPDAAGLINLECGPNFVNTTVAQLGSATSLRGAGISPIFLLAATVAFLFI